MACVYPNCSKAKWDHWNSGGVGDLCETHYQAIKDDLEKPINHVKAYDYTTYTEDYIRLYALMLNRELVLAQIKKLNNEMNQKVLLNTTGANSEFGKLSTALSYYETRCWFPNVHIVLVGLLAADDFLKIMKSGYIPKDVGAGATHGEFSHRLQWHAVMRIATNDFSTAKAAGWDHAPYELFVRLGEKPEIDRPVWGVIFDAQGQCGYRDPSSLNGDIRTSTDSNLGLIAPKLASTYRKRVAIDKIGDTYGFDQTKTPEYENELDGITDPKAKGQFQAKKSNEFHNAVLQPSYLKHKGFKVSTQEQALLDELHAVQNKSLPKRLKIFFQGTGYQQIMNGTALIRSDETALTPQQVSTRVNSCKSALCSEPFP
jgi:hypothetical protein